MTNAELTISAAGTPEQVVLRLAGELDMATARTLQERTDGALAAGPASLLIDLGGVSFLGSGGLSAIVHTFTAARAAGCEMALVNVPAFAYRVLEIVGLTRVVDVRP